MGQPLTKDEWKAQLKHEGSKYVGALALCTGKVVVFISSTDNEMMADFAKEVMAYAHKRNVAVVIQTTGIEP